MSLLNRIHPAYFIVILLLISSCRTPAPVLLPETGELEEADITAGELASLIPDYSDRLETLSGEGRALVSSPEGSERVTIHFHSDRESSLITLRNRVGIEGGELLVKNDSLLIYNRVDETAEKVSLKDPRLSGTWAIATVNLIELFHQTADEQEILRIRQDNRYYVADLRDGSRVTIDRGSGLITDILGGADTSFGRISYEAYDELDGFRMPRRLTILSRDRKTRITLLIRQLQVNRSIPELEIDIPEEIPVQIL